MKTTPDNQKLLDLVEAARKGRIVLPQFQRNFVWSREDITGLLLSVLQGHYIGSFLLMNADSDNIPFAYRPLEGVALTARDLHPEIMILDGQQRLTSLNYVFTAPDIPLRNSKYAHLFFLNLKAVVDEDWDNVIQTARKVDADEMLVPQYQFENLVVPMTKIETWNDWQNAYEQWLVSRDRDLYFNQYFTKHKPVWNVLLDRIRGFLVPTITLPKIQPDDHEALAEICSVFEKINSTGVKLSVYDLLTARLYKNKIDMHQLWQDAIDKNHLLAEVSGGTPDEFGVYLLRTVALLRNQDVKSRTLINLSPKDFESDWRNAVEAFEKALQRINSIGEDGFGAFATKWIPYVTMASPLAAMLHQIGKQKPGPRAYRWIQRWYWSAVFRERYAGSIETVIYRDYQDFVNSLADPTVLSDAWVDARTGILDNPSFSLRSVSRVNSIYRGVICLIALNGAKDFGTDDSIQFHTLEDHHVFPFAYLKKQTTTDNKPYTADRMNCVINRTLISDQANRQISDHAPAKYLREILPAETAETLLNGHFIPASALAAMRDNDFETFVTVREQALIAEIHRRIQG